MSTRCENCGFEGGIDPLCPACGHPIDPHAENVPAPAYPVVDAGVPAVEDSTVDRRVVVLTDPAGTTHVSRLSVLFRLILAIPQLFVLWVVGIAVVVVMVIAWWVALFTARVPAWAYDFLGWYTALYARVMSYLYLLVDKWPSFGDPAAVGRATAVPTTDQSAVVVRFPGPERLNRLAVFFRVVLIVPVYVVAYVLSLGGSIALFFVWLVVLILGRVPTPVFDGLAAAVRYQVRYNAYAFLLTSAYPSGLFGDPVAPADPAGTAGTADPAVPAVPAEVPDAVPVAPRRTPGARWVVIALLVLGVLSPVAEVVALVALVGSQSNDSAADADTQLYRAYLALSSVPQAHCASGAGQFDCVKRFDGRFAARVQSFDDAVGGIDFPSDVDSRVSTAHSDDAKLAADLRALSEAPTPEAYAVLVRSGSLTTDANTVDADVEALHRQLVSDF